MIFKNALRRRLWISLGILVFSMAAFLGISYSVVRYQGIRDLELALAETDKLDPYWRLEDLEAHRRPMPPPDHNGFEQVLKAAEVMPTQPWPWPAFPQFDNDRGYQARVVREMRRALEQHDRLAPTLLNQEAARVLRAELQRAKDSVSKARRMVDFPIGRGSSLVPLRISGAPAVPPYMRMLEVGRMLEPDSRVRIYDGDVADALLDVRAMLHISLALEEEPSLFAQLVHSAMDRIALGVLEDTLANGTLSERALALVQKELEHEESNPKVLFGLKCERALRDRLFQDAQSGMFSFDDFQTLVGEFGNPGASALTRFVGTSPLSLLWSDLPGARARQLRYDNELISIGQLPVQKRFEALQNHLAQLQSQSGDMLGWEAPLGGMPIMYAKYLLQDVDTYAVLSCAVTAVATERFRLTHGRWPQNLDELTPLYLKSLPLDPFSGQPLLLVREGSMLIIYSVGEDLTDDGGIVGQKSAKNGADVGFVLHDPAARRRPGPPFVFPERKVNGQKKVEPSSGQNKEKPGPDVPRK